MKNQKQLWRKKSYEKATLELKSFSRAITQLLPKRKALLLVV
jgi:hypothetical protein